MEPVDITAGRLHLRPWQRGDEPALLAAFGDPDTQRWTSRPVPYLPEHARAYVEQVSLDGWRSGKDLTFAVCDSTSGAVLGGAALHPGRDEGVRDVGYWTMPEARGHGVASDALATVSRWALASLEVARLEWRAEVGNWASRRVAERAGFTIEGALRGGLLRREQHVDGWIGARLPDDPHRDTGAFPSYAPLSDGVVTLRRWRESDAADVARACDDAETARWLPVPVPYGEVDGLAYVGGIVPTEWFAGAAANVAVVDAGDGALLGAVGLTPRSGIAEVGYWTAPWARSRGVAARATVLHTGWGFEVLGLPRVELLADVDNGPSQRVAEKAGFVREGVLRAVRPAPRGDGGRRDMVLYARLP